MDGDKYSTSVEAPRKLSLPPKSELKGLQDNQLLVSLKEEWTPEGQTKRFAPGTVISLNLNAAKADSVHLKPTVLFAPTDLEFAQQVATTKNHVLLTTLEHVQGRAYVYTHGKDGMWTRKQLPVPKAVRSTLWAAPSSAMWSRRRSPLRSPRTLST